MSEVKFTKASFNSTMIDRALNALAGLWDVIKGFLYVANPAGQAFQREIDKPVSATFKVKGRKTPVSITLPTRWQPAINPHNGSRVKGNATRFLRALRAKHVSDNSAVPLACELLAFFTAKVLTSRSESKEAGLLSYAITHLQDESGITIRSIAIGDESYPQDEVMAKIAERIHYLEVMQDAGLLQPSSSGSDYKTRLSDTPKL
jgi:hypothetical protein